VCSVPKINAFQMPPSNSNTMAPKRRRALTDLERRNIRQRNATNPSTQNALIAWFQEQTGHSLDQGQLSRILSSKYDHLDTDIPLRPSESASKRQVAGDWPDLEMALFDWQQRIQGKKGIVTGDILKSKAAEIWQALPQYQGQPVPKWSNGWLDRFKKRFKIKEYVTHGEGGTAAVDSPESIAQMAAVRLLCTEYAPKDIFNMDETGLFWKRTPDRTLATESASGGKKAKDRITLALTANGDGSELLKPWIIGKSKNPRCFKHINRQLLNIEYRYNKTKWMTGLICQEFLKWFDNQMRGRKVLLLLDNFSGHELGLRLAEADIILQNTRVVWLPPNTTSHWQPMDQGIIAAFKLLYQRCWISYMIRQFDADLDPLKTVNLLHAVQWSTYAWNQVKPEAIQRCFWKSTCIQRPDFITQDLAIQIQDQAELDQLQAQIMSIPSLLDPISASELVQLADEEITDKDVDIMATILEIYSTKPDAELESEESDIEAEQVSIKQATQAIETLKLWELQQEDGNLRNISILGQIERDIQSKRGKNGKQQKIDSFFNTN
jgi:hypothetical protein